MKLAVPIPARMAKLKLDARGYPVPFIVLVDAAGIAQFTINDGRKTELARRLNLCGICGTKLFRGHWFVGGPISALHLHGVYFDGPLHSECARFALQVCPWLAAPKYAKRIEDARMKPENVPEGIGQLVDPTVMNHRPSCFVAVMAIGHEFVNGHYRPNRPYRTIEFWRQGKRLSDAEGRDLAAEDLKRLAPAVELTR